MPINETNLSYRVINDLTLTARLYSPTGDNPTPYVVDAHGGAWCGGDKMSNRIIHQHLVNAGIGVFALDFRLSPQAPYPLPIQDINFGIRWFKQNATSIGANISTLGGLGTSSGGQQMGLIALQPNKTQYSEQCKSLQGTDAALDFFIGLWPILDPLARYKMVKQAGKQKLVNAHHLYFSNEKQMMIGNPCKVLYRRDATHMPPCLLIQGENDENVDHRNLDVFADLYQKLGGKVQVHKYSNQPHEFIIQNPNDSSAKHAMSTLIDFILTV